MNKLSLFLAIAAVAILTSCSDEKGTPPTPGELCKNGPSAECLAGNWTFEGVYENLDLKSYQCPKPGSLKLEGDGIFEFTGGEWNLKPEEGARGDWTIDGSTISIRGGLYNPASGNVEILREGKEMIIRATGDQSLFAMCNSDKIEKFTR